MTTQPSCAYCGKPNATHRDHVVPRSRGGPDTAANIVMACQPCNAAKSDQLPSEWLGDRCPAPVLLIEARVNAKLKQVFSRRGQQPKQSKLFAFHVGSDGEFDYIGEVVGETPTTIRLNLADGLSFCCGLWDLSGELRDLPRTECRLFLDRDTCAEAASRFSQSRRSRV